MKPVIYILFTCCILWMLGLVWFVLSLETRAADLSQTAKAVVVLTGGAERIDHGFALLEAGRADRLFISGVGAQNSEASLMDSFAISDALKEKLRQKGVLTLDHAADSTYRNAQETAKWIRNEGITRFFLVTANYHMPRSLIEFRLALPDATIIPEPVFPLPDQRISWWEDADTRRLVMIEYQKFLVVLVRSWIHG